MRRRVSRNALNRGHFGSDLQATAIGDSRAREFTLPWRPQRFRSPQVGLTSPGPRKDRLTAFRDVVKVSKFRRARTFDLARGLGAAEKLSQTQVSRLPRASSTPPITSVGLMEVAAPLGQSRRESRKGPQPEPEGVERKSEALMRVHVKEQLEVKWYEASDGSRTRGCAAAHLVLTPNAVQPRVEPCTALRGIRQTTSQPLRGSEPLGQEGQLVERFEGAV